MDINWPVFAAITAPLIASLLARVHHEITGSLRSE